jgi:fibronectin-binding autotransporter adhesin
MHTKKLLMAFVFGLGMTLVLVWLLGTSLVIAAPTANLSVTKFTDSADGSCDVSDCSLREAIIAANGNSQDNTIELGSGAYALSLTTGGSEPEYGDLDVTSGYALTITGNGPENTIIDAGGIDRVLDLYSAANTVVISGVTIYGGVTTGSGGGIYKGGGDLSLINVAVVSNTATSGGGGIRLDGSGAVLTMDENCLVARNESTYDGGGLSISYGAGALLGGGRIVSNTAVLGGGVYAYQGSVTMSGVEIVSNTAIWYGGGVFVQNGTATLNGGAILSNTARTSGGGLYVSGGAFTQTGQSVIGHNTAYTRGGGIHVPLGTVVLNGGQIIHNRVTGAGDDSYGGGGIYVGASNATLIQTGSNIIIENTAEMHGGGVYVGEGKVTLSGGQILSNTAGEKGGGIYLHGAVAFTQTAGLIAYNAAQGTDTEEGGGGIYSLYENSVKLSGGQILGNRANRGGGLYIRTGSFNLLGAEIVGNRATLFGGGVYAGLLGWSTPIKGGRIISNTAEYGGGLYAIAGNVTLERGQIVGNHANSEGGGVYHNTGGSFGVLTLVNTTVSGNTATDDGGALVNASGTTMLTYTTVASNTTDPTGYGIRKEAGSTILVKNTIIAYNSPWNCDSGALTSQGNNIADDFTCGLGGTGDQPGVDPELASLAEDKGTLIHAIAQGSPAQDAGVCQMGITTDQRGMPRLAPCDVGAYEYALQVFLPLVSRNHP